MRTASEHFQQPGQQDASFSLANCPSAAPRPPPGDRVPVPADQPPRQLLARETAGSAGLPFAYFSDSCRPDLRRPAAASAAVAVAVGGHPAAGSCGRMASQLRILAARLRELLNRLSGPDGIQVKAMVTDLHLSIPRTLGVSMGTSVVYTATLLGVASGWVFPIPFSVVVGAVPALVCYVSFFLLGIGRHALVASSGLGKQLRLQTYVIGVHALLVLVYPAFSSLFFAVTPTNRIGLVLVLPIIKLLMKNVVAWASSHLEDYVPVIVVFSVEVFNALYVASCMQTANSWLTTVVILAFDVLRAVLTFLALHLRTRSIQKQQLKLRQLRQTTTQEPEDLLTTVLQLCHQPRVLESHRATTIRLRSPLKLQISMAQSQMLDELVGRQAVESTQQPDKRDGKRTFSYRPKWNSIWDVPAPPATEEQQVLVIQDALKLLFECEYHALVELVECAVPTLYGVYLTILCQLPNGKYYAHVRAMRPGQLQTTLLMLAVYVALEMLSFAAMHIVLKRRLNISLLHQLAFVLETQMLELQGRLSVWIIFILQFALQHLGLDFTFRFDWMQQPRNQ